MQICFNFYTENKTMQVKSKSIWQSGQRGMTATYTKIKN